MNIMDEINELQEIDFPPIPTDDELNTLVQDMKKDIVEHKSMPKEYVVIINTTSVTVYAHDPQTALRKVFKQVAEQGILCTGSFEIQEDRGGFIELPLSILFDLLSIHELIFYQFNISFLLEVQKNPLKYMKSKQLSELEDNGRK